MSDQELSGKPVEIEKTPVSKEWTETERLKVIRLIVKSTVGEKSPFEMRMLLDEIYILVTQDPSFLEGNRSRFAKYISQPENNLTQVSRDGEEKGGEGVATE